MLNNDPARGDAPTVSDEAAPFLRRQPCLPGSMTKIETRDEMADNFRDELIALMPRLRRYAMALTGSSAEADDLVQDSLVRAWRFREGFQQGSNLNAWAHRIVRNTFYTSAQSRRNTVQDVDGKYAAQLSCNPDQEWRLQYGELLSALDKLTDDARDALLLVVAADMSYEEAAEIAGCPVGTMKSRVNRARERLAELVGIDLSRPKPRAERKLVPAAPARRWAGAPLAAQAA